MKWYHPVAAVATFVLLLVGALGYMHLRDRQGLAGGLKPEPRKFMGEVSSRSLDYSLDGMWNVQACNGPNGEPNKRGCWAAVWNLKESTPGQWRERDTGSRFCVLGKGPPQWLVECDEDWVELRAYSINHVGNGMLVLTDGDGGSYLAVRAENGEGN